MLVKYCGNRNVVSITCSGRKILYFGPENNFTVDITDDALASEVLASPLHKFQVIIPTHVEVKPAPAKIVLPVEKPKKVKKGKKNG